MSAHPSTTRNDRMTESARRAPNRTRRLSTETKAAFKTTEFFAFVAVLIGVLIAAAVIDETDAGGFGARQAWLYATILTVGYMVSRGLAKSGSRDPYDADGRLCRPTRGRAGSSRLPAPWPAYPQEIPRRLTARCRPRR
jgi:hypothetical protein